MAVPAITISKWSTRIFAVTPWQQPCLSSRWMNRRAHTHTHTHHTLTKRGHRETLEERGVKDTCKKLPGFSNETPSTCSNRIMVSGGKIKPNVSLWETSQLWLKQGTLEKFGKPGSAQSHIRRQSKLTYDRESSSAWSASNLHTEVFKIPRKQQIACFTRTISISVCYHSPLVPHMGFLLSHIFSAVAPGSLFFRAVIYIHL